MGFYEEGSIQVRFDRPKSGVESFHMSHLHSTLARALLLPDATVRMRWLRLRRKLEVWSEEEGG